MRFFVDERQIVYMGFVVASRIVVGLLIMLVAKLTGRKSQPGVSDLTPCARLA